MMDIKEIFAGIAKNACLGAAGAVIAGRALEMGAAPIPAIGAGAAIAVMCGCMIERMSNDHTRRCRRKAAHRRRMQAAMNRRKLWQAPPTYRRVGEVARECEEKKPPIQAVKGALGNEFEALSDAEKAEVLDGSYAKAAKNVPPIPFRQEFGLL
jgi:hypothetical protein